jgi:Fe-Mn family superoxide dismutase
MPAGGRKAPSPLAVGSTPRQFSGRQVGRANLPTGDRATTRERRTIQDDPCYRYGLIVTVESTMSFTLPDLPYPHDALAPYMSRETLEYHHDKHHLAYVNNGNNLLKGTEWEGKSLEDIVKGSFGKNAGLFNNAGQHYNHLHFWQWMKPNGGGDKLPGNLEKKITSDLGSVAKMKEEFINAGVTQFGSGWCWLAVKDGKIIVSKTANGESPLVHGGKPILGCDVWEHSYYIDYRNRRPDYLKAFLDHLVNWDHVAKMYDAASA